MESMFELSPRYSRICVNEYAETRCGVYWYIQECIAAQIVGNHEDSDSDPLLLLCLIVTCYYIMPS